MQRKFECILLKLERFKLFVQQIQCYRNVMIIIKFSKYLVCLACLSICLHVWTRHLKNYEKNDCNVIKGCILQKWLCIVCTNNSLQSAVILIKSIGRLKLNEVGKYLFFSKWVTRCCRHQPSRPARLCILAPIVWECRQIQHQVPRALLDSFQQNWMWYLLLCQQQHPSQQCQALESSPQNHLRTKKVPVSRLQLHPIKSHQLPVLMLGPLKATVLVGCQRARAVNLGDPHPQAQVGDTVILSLQAKIFYREVKNLKTSCTY